MTQPVWMASPPEVHSALLSAGPGPGPLLAAAGAWRSLGSEYLHTASELTALLGEVRASAWQGPTAEAYAAANAPYLEWLRQAGSNSVAVAAQHDAAATAYTVALAAMPTLAELAANHAAHAVLVATNFFGINTIPIALNEADYVRMWVQAATVMATYQSAAGSATAAAAAAQTQPAPPIAKARAAAASSDSPGQDTSAEVQEFLDKIGYTEFYNKYIAPLGNPFFPEVTQISQIDPFLIPLEGNPLFYLNPLFLAQAFGEPLDISLFVTFQVGNFTYAMGNITAALATGNPATIAGTIGLQAVQLIGLGIINTIQLLHYLLQQTVALLPAVLPLLTAPLAGVPGSLSGLSGLAGLAGLAGLPPPSVAPVIPPVGIALAQVPVSAPAPPPPAPVPAPAPAAPPPTVPPPAAGPPPVATGAEAFGYMVGGLGQSASRKASNSAGQAKSPKPADSAAAAAAAESTAEQATAARRRRRRATVKELGRGYEYMDLEPEAPDETAASDHGTGAVGSTGATATARVAKPAGLMTRVDKAFGGNSGTPMMPGGWLDDTE